MTGWAIFKPWIADFYKFDVNVNINTNIGVNIEKDGDTEKEHIKWVMEEVGLCLDFWGQKGDLPADIIEFGTLFHHQGTKQEKSLDWDFLPHSRTATLDRMEQEGALSWRSSGRWVLC